MHTVPSSQLGWSSEESPFCSRRVQIVSERAVSTAAAAHLCVSVVYDMHNYVLTKDISPGPSYFLKEEVTSEIQFQGLEYPLWSSFSSIPYIARVPERA